MIPASSSTRLQQPETHIAYIPDLNYITQSWQKGHLNIITCCKRIPFYQIRPPLNTRKPLTKSVTTRGIRRGDNLPPTFLVHLSIYA